jgi:signal transduction histidine kinase
MRKTLVGLGLCLAVLLGGVGWITVTALRLEASEARARRQGALEETVRLALWRLDSDLAPLLARESSRPYFQYAAFYAEERGWTRMYAPVSTGDVLVPSPLLTDKPSEIRLYFQYTLDGKLSSPQVPEGDLLRLALSSGVPEERIRGAAALLEALRRDVPLPALLAAVDLPAAPAGPTRAVRGEALRSANEYQMRSKTMLQAANSAQLDNNATLVAPDASALRAVWLGAELLLVRRAKVLGTSYLQGFELDWPVVAAWLRADLRDLLPNARLEPAERGGETERLLASLPVRLEPGELAVAVEKGGAPVAVILCAAWAAVLVAAATVVALLLGTLALSERRAAFVSAVTHELRTPLTTVRTYTEMLADDLVPPDKRQRYLETLSREAVRLARLVDNVLLYARLERGRSPRAGTVSVAALLDRARPRLEERVATSGMTLVVDAPPDATVVADPDAVEQILFNLADNACKYAGAGAVRLTCALRGGDVLVRVSDGGPGIAQADRRWLFEPFARSAERAAGAAPGVGLGLALCRRLARAMGGDLTLEDGPGAIFALRIRRAPG